MEFNLSTIEVTVDKSRIITIGERFCGDSIEFIRIVTGRHLAVRVGFCEMF